MAILRPQLQVESIYDQLSQANITDSKIRKIHVKNTTTKNR